MEIRKINANVRVVSKNGFHVIEVFKSTWVQASEPFRSYARALDTAFQMI